jgi:sugar fermentation stimulation protein A
MGKLGGTGMRYDNIRGGRFITRLNRFEAAVEIDGREQLCHVKNTGRCKELLVPGAAVFAQV